MGRFLLQAIIAAILVATVYSCSCIPSSFSDKYCRADYVARVRVLDNGVVVGMDKRYTVVVEHFYKSKYNPYTVDRTYLYTGTNSAACGVNLQPGTTYVITGYFDTGRSGLFRRRKMRTGLCDAQLVYNYNFFPPICRAQINGYAQA